MQDRKHHCHGHDHRCHCHYHPCCCHQPPELRLEAVTTCVGFDDLLDETLNRNMSQVDTMIVVTTHGDKATHKVVNKHGAVLVLTDLFTKNGRNFNKGAAINMGFGRFQYHGWRLHIDSDIALPTQTRRLLLNHAHLDTRCIYGADRMNVIGKRSWDAVQTRHQFQFGSHVKIEHPMEHRFVDPLNGYTPIGFFQLWHASYQKPYPYSLGTAAHDDTLFSAQWPREFRRHLPDFVVYHLLSRASENQENWDGNRQQPRFS